MTNTLHDRRLAVTAVLVTAMSFCAGCTPPMEESIGFGPSDVEMLDVYVYPYGASGSAAKHLEVTDKREIASWTSFFDYLPLQPDDPEQNNLIGQQVIGFRFHLYDKENLEISQVAVGIGDIVIIQSDGSRWVSEYGSPYTGSLAEAEMVDVADAPRIGTR